jgi:cell pole-organizing protein PopZ
MSVANVPLTTSSLDAERRAYEPSMEEILASIRKIIADDDSLPAMRGAGRHSMDDSSAAPARDHEATGRGDSEFAAVREAPHVSAPRSDRWPRPISRPEVSPSSIVAAKDEPRSGSSFDNWRRSHADELTPRAHEPRKEALSAEMIQPRRPIVEEDKAQSNGEAFEESAEAPARTAVVPAHAEDEAPASEAAHQPLVSPDAAASVAAHFQTLAASMIMNDSGLLQRCAEEMLRPMLKQWLDDNLPVLVERLVRSEIERVARGRR